MQLGYKIVLGLFYMSTGIVGLLGNTFLLYVILRNKRQRKKPSSIYLVTLALTDLCGAFTFVSYFMMSLDLPDFKPSLRQKYKIPCQFGTFFVYGVGINRILALALMSADRYLAILHPFLYQARVDSRRVIIANLFIFLQSLTTNFPMLVAKDWVNYDGRPGAPCGFVWKGKIAFLFPYFILNFGIPFIILMIANFKVFKTARKQRMKILSEQLDTRQRQQSLFFGMLDSELNEPCEAQEVQNRSSTGFVIEDNCFNRSALENNNGKSWLTNSTTETRLSRCGAVSSVDGNKPAYITSFGKRTDGEERDKTSSKNRIVRPRERFHANDIIIAFSTIVLVIAFLVSWLPFALSRVIFVLDRSLFSWDTVVWTSSLTIINCACNPLIVLGTRKDLRRPIGELFKNLRNT